MATTLDLADVSDPIWRRAYVPLFFFYVVLENVLWHTEPMDDVLSFFITIGSPALAAYSLQITHLNTRWITTAFVDVKYPNSKYIATALSAFHHVPIKISHHPPFLHSLIVLPRNNDFWSTLAAANKTRRWSIPLIMTFVLVIFSLILTILVSIFTTRPGSIGYAIAATWSFLLPLIIGWLQVGCEPEPSHLRNSLEAANLKAWAATDHRDRPVKSPLAIEFKKDDDVGFARKDELKPVPVFNYSRAFICPLDAEQTLALVKNAAANADQRIPVSNTVGRGVPAWVEGEGKIVPDENRVGTDTEVTEYCTRVLTQFKWNSISTAPFSIQTAGTPNTPSPLLPFHDPHLATQAPSRWATGVWERVALATVLALVLQWGTAGAAVIIHYLAPPPGLGCRAISFMLYGMAGTVSFFFFLASSILAHMSRPYPGQAHTQSRLNTYQNIGAIVCRWLGKCIAVSSAMGILLVCFFQVTGAFNNCFCASTTFDKGRGSVVFVTINYVIGPSVSKFWIAGLVMAFGTGLLFSFSMYLSKAPRR